MHDNTVFIAHVKMSFIRVEAKGALSRTHCVLIPCGQTVNERVASSRQCRAPETKCVGECQEPQWSQRRVYILNVSEFVVQGVSFKTGTDYGRAGSIISR